MKNWLYLTLLINLFFSPLAWAEVWTGTYTGNGSDNRQITIGSGTSFQPDFVMIKTAGSLNPIIKADTPDFTSAATDDSQAWNRYSSTGLTDYIQELNSTGFEVGTNASVNAATVVYYYWCFKNTDSAVVIGEYTGDDADDRSITHSLGTTAEMVWTAGFVSDYRARVADSTDTGNAAFFNYLASPGANAIQDVDITSTAFQIGSHTSVNKNAIAFRFFAFADSSDLVEVGRYTGNGTDDRDITIGFTPDLVFVCKQNSYADAILRVTSQSTDEALDISDRSGEPMATNAIQTFGTNTFQVGTNNYTNQNTHTFYYLALKHDDGAASGPSRGNSNFVLTNGILTDSGT